jgi:hypothetical protein
MHCQRIEVRYGGEGLVEEFVSPCSGDMIDERSDRLDVDAIALCLVEMIQDIN